MNTHSHPGHAPHSRPCRPSASPRLLGLLAIGLLPAFASIAAEPAGGGTPSQPSSPATHPTAPQKQALLPAIEVTGTRSYADQYLLPQTTESVTAAKIRDTVNAADASDALKYLPDILVRKRYIGDTQAPMATRTTGINASARSLIYVDGILLSALINNNNQNGSPQWFMVTPQEIQRVDVLYGPFAARFPGNSYGGVTQITTRMPTRFEAHIDALGALQNFSQYGTDDNALSQRYGLSLGDRSGKLSWRLSVGHLDSHSQPITYGTVARSGKPASGPTLTGAYADRNRTGNPILVLGAGNLTHTVQDNATLKLAYDFTPSLTATYTLGYWQNDAKAHADTYLRTADGTPYYGGASGTVDIDGHAYDAASLAKQFSSSWTQQSHLMQGLNIGTHTNGAFDWNLAISRMDYLKDLSRMSTGRYPEAADGGPGRVTDMKGTGWTTLDLSGTWRPDGEGGSHIVSFGAHGDQFKLDSPTYSASDWTDSGSGPLYSDSQGTTRTAALWLQDVWRLSPALTATVGARYEWWRADDGYNYSLGASGGVSIAQPAVDKAGLSPKASLRWDVNDEWSVTGSIGKALRFPTVGELYQSVQTGATFTQANPYLQPESVISGELAIERDTERGKLRLSLFNEYVSDALISQTSLVPGYASPVSFTQNVDRTRQMGVELAGQLDDAFIHGLSLSGSVTYVDSRILADDGFVPAYTGDTAVGKRVPYVPTWRTTLVATYRPDDKWAYTAALRHSSRVYATVDNSDINPATYQGFESFTVVDARIRYQIDKHWGLALGVDNLTNRGYFLYHPFPERTFYAQMQYAS